MPQKLEDFEVLGIIGRGTTGTCYKVQNKFSKELFAWKAVDYGNLTEENKKLLVSEVNLLRSLDHPNIVKYCGRILHKETTTLYIITEWCEGGDLGDLIKSMKSTKSHLEEPFIWRMLYQISRAIQVCHSRLQDCTIFHRDIKPANVFLDRHGNAKLGDFGLARTIHSENEFSETFVGTPFYMSPEVIKGNKYNRKSDIWALGCLIYELCALAPPFNGANMLELADTIKSGKYKTIPLEYSDDMKKIISFMLSKKHEFRPTIEMILHHPSVVMNIKSNSEVNVFKRITSRNGHYDSEINESLENDLVNLTLVDPEHISNKVFKDKWTEKHEALKEKEAWLKKREKNLGNKEKFLANREKHLQILERQAKHKQYLMDIQLHQKKESLACGHIQDGNETDATVEPMDTPIRPTSAKLDPFRLPRPDILNIACKKIGQTSVTNIKAISEKHIPDYSAKVKDVSTVRRMLKMNSDIIHNKIRLDKTRERRVHFNVLSDVNHQMKSGPENLHNQIMQKSHSLLNKEHHTYQSHEIVNGEKENDQFINGLRFKPTINHGIKSSKGTTLSRSKKLDNLRIPKCSSNKENVIVNFI